MDAMPRTQRQSVLNGAEGEGKVFGRFEAKNGNVRIGSEDLD